MLVDDDQVLEKIFADAQTIVVTHCEDTPTITANEEEFRRKFGEDIPLEYHPQIRSEEACYLSTTKATDLAKRHGTKLHVLHLTTAKELCFFSAGDIRDKQITVEVCAHHLYFNEKDYHQRGGLIKCNPAIKTEQDQQALIRAVANNQIDIIATDHAPHTMEEKTGTYFKIAAGLPLVQYALVSALELVHEQQLSIEKLVQVTSHNVAERFGISNRGYLREGYWADIAVVDMQTPCTDTPDRVLYRCGWSPFDGIKFRSSIANTIVNGQIVYQDGDVLARGGEGQRLQFLA